MRKPNLLIIDDEKDFVTTMLKRLQRRGIKCQGAYTGGEALECISRSDFDVVLLDMKLPDMDGNEVLRQSKRIKPHVRFFILTGHASISEGQKGLSEGATDYLLKPMEFEALLEKLFAGNDWQARGSPADAS